MSISLASIFRVYLTDRTRYFLVPKVFATKIPKSLYNIMKNLIRKEFWQDFVLALTPEDFVF